MLPFSEAKNVAVISPKLHVDGLFPPSFKHYFQWANSVMKCDVGPGDQHLSVIGRGKMKKTQAGPSLYFLHFASDPALFLAHVFFSC